jgi:hypothetical protein
LAVREIVKEANMSNIEIAARALAQHRGFRWVTDPMECGQDAYDICLEAVEEARAVLRALGIQEAA